ncbi:MAG: hypothetical protein GDA65_17060 [Nitrospira sp. CR1.1]|nr:hypothetical protein [Nitrospira sp. CR1.1]
MTVIDRGNEAGARSVPDVLIGLLSSVAKGNTAVFAKDVSERVIKAEWIKCLALGLPWPVEVHERWKEIDPAHMIPEGGGSVPIGYSGLRIRGAEIVGSLDLSGCGSTQSPLPALSLEECIFQGEGHEKPSIDLSEASLCGLSLKNSRFRHLRGVGMAVAGSVKLSGIRPSDESDHARCWCKLSLCTIDGDLVADNTTMRAPDIGQSGEPAFHDFSELNWAVNTYGSRITGSILLRKSPVLEGGLLMDRAHIGGDVYIEGAQVTAISGRRAVAMERARIDGSLTLVGAHNSDKKMQCAGSIYLMLCEVGGSVDIGRVKFLVHTGHREALYAIGLSVRGWITLDTVASERPITLKDAQIGGNLRVEEVRIQTLTSLKKGSSREIESGLVLSGVRVAGTLVLKENGVADGIDMTDVRCATLHDKKSGYGDATSILIDGFRCERIDGINDSFDVEERLKWWLPKGEHYRPQPYVQLAQVLANHGEDALVRKVLFHKAKEDAAHTWNDKIEGKKGPLLKRLVEITKRSGRRIFYWLVVWPFGFFFEFGLSPTKAVSTVIAFIVFGCAMFGYVDSKKALVVAQTPVTTLVREDDADPHKYKFASAFVSKEVPKSESESVNGPASVQSSVSRDLTTPVKDSVPTNKSTPVEGRVSTQKPVIVKGAQPVIKPAPAKEVASIAALEPIQKPVPANASAGKKEQQHSDYSDSDVPCRDSIRLLVYAADVFIPLVDLREEGKCEIDKAKGSEVSDGLITTFRLMKALYAIIGWLVTGAAVVTISGVMRHRLLRD